MTKQGKVVKQTKDKVKIEVYTEGGCDNCHLQGVCKPQNGRHFLKLTSSKQFESGDEVEVSVSEGKSIGFSFLLFIVPIFVILTVYLLVQHFVKVEWVSILSSMLGGAAYFVAIGQIENRLIQKTAITKRNPQ